MTQHDVTDFDDSRLCEYVLRLGDDQLILGHRLSEWLGHAPILEEDIALANLSLDCLGSASNLLDLAGELEGKGRSADDLAYRRDEREFRNCLLVEQPNGDFGVTIVRQFLYDAFAFHVFGALRNSRCAPLAEISSRALKEVTYHLRHGRDWIVRLGRGTDESRERIQAAVELLWPYTLELFESNNDAAQLATAGVVVDPSSLESMWTQVVADSLEAAGIELPQGDMPLQSGGRSGRHSEHLGHVLAEMQFLPRAHPEATW